MAESYRCDDGCVCPVHGIAMWYSAAGNDHACQDPECEYAQGGRASLYDFRFKMPSRPPITEMEIAALSRIGLYDFEVPPNPVTDEEIAALPRLDLNDFYAQEAHVHEIDLDKLNSATKYPSIETYHKLERGILQEEAVEFDGEAFASEKVDGTNSRLIALPDGDWFIGSREHLLSARGDRVANPNMGIVKALKPLADKLAVDNGPMITVFYLETYGHGIGAAAKSYTGGGNVGTCLFDVAFIPEEVFGWAPEMIAQWRDNGGQQFAPEGTLRRCAVAKDLIMTERLLTVAAGELPTTVQDTYDWMSAVLPHTRASLDASGTGKPEGIVLRSRDRKTIAKARFEDYERTLKRRAGAERDGHHVDKRR